MAHLARAPADLVVLDLMLPGLDGMAVCRAMRARPATAAIPIIMLTARGDEADRVAGLDEGADDYVTKPFSPKELVARVDRAASPVPASLRDRPDDRIRPLRHRSRSMPTAPCHARTARKCG